MANSSGRNVLILLNMRCVLRIVQQCFARATHARRLFDMIQYSCSIYIVSLYMYDYEGLGRAFGEGVFPRRYHF